MSGLVPRADYDRVVRERDRLADEVAWLRAELVDMTDPRLVELRTRFGLRRAPAAAVLAVLDKGRVTARRLAGMLGSESVRAAQVHVCRANRALEGAGSPQRPIRCVGWYGYVLTDEGRQWLSERVYGAFQEAGKKEAMR